MIKDFVKFAQQQNIDVKILQKKIDQSHKYTLLQFKDIHIQHPYLAQYQFKIVKQGDMLEFFDNSYTYQNNFIITQLLNDTNYSKQFIQLMIACKKDLQIVTQMIMFIRTDETIKKYQFFLMQEKLFLMQDGQNKQKQIDQLTSKVDQQQQQIKQLSQKPDQINDNFQLFIISIKEQLDSIQKQQALIQEQFTNQKNRNGVFEEHTQMELENIHKQQQIYDQSFKQIIHQLSK